MNRGALTTWSLAFTVPLALAAGCGGDREPPSASIADATSTSLAVTAPAPSTSPPTTSIASSTTTTPVVATSAASTSSSTSSTMPTAPVTELTGEHVELQSVYMPEPFALDHVGDYGDIQVYDGVSESENLSVRCLAITRAGMPGWLESCTDAGHPGSFVFLNGIDPWIVDYGADVGDVVLAQQPTDWSITSGGCSEPIVNLVAAADIEPAVAGGIACVQDEAFLTYGMVLMQSGPVDGGGLLLINGAEGWYTEGGGTSIGCANFADGIDRCELFGVEDELFEAGTPIPSPELLPPAVDAINVREQTDAITALADGALDLEGITDVIVAGLAQPDAEVAPAVIRHDNLHYGQLSLLIVDVPLMDDATRSTTTVVWISVPGDDQPVAIRRAYAWDNCARGVSQGLCV